MIKEENLSAIRNKLEEILNNLDASSKSKIPLHQMERSIFNHLLSLGLLLLRHYIGLCQDVVESRVLTTFSPKHPFKSKGVSVRSYFSVFGELSLIRSKYYCQGLGVYYPLDAYLGLPDTKYSYLIRDWLAYGATEMDFRQSCDYLNHILGYNFSGMQSSRCTKALSLEVASFYDQKSFSQVSQEAYLSVGFDGKGVPMILSELGKTADSSATRLSKGQKRGSKKEATVSLSSSFTPKSRSPGQLIDALFKKPLQKKLMEEHKEPNDRHLWHEAKHLRAFIADKPKAIHYGLSNLLARDTQKNTPIVVLIDGDRALRNQVETQAKVLKMETRIEAYVLDFIHLLEYVWKVANAYLGENHSERTKWVEAQALLLLNSKSKQVITKWKAIQELKHLSKNQRENVTKAITYLSNKEEMVDYKDYLKKGYPITTGAVESACGHFVKSRMERNAMHWSFKGGQNMLNIRAVRKNHDWNDFLEFFIGKDQRRIYKKVA